jgi:hypothetical protein
LEPKLQRARASAPEPEPEPEPPAAVPPETTEARTEGRRARETNGKPEHPVRAADSNRRSLSGPSPMRFRPGPVSGEEEE